jgi:energy-coupling factor transporter ATP-binding protein EcfA2
VSSNPFSTRFIRPGAIPFIFSAGESAESLVDRLCANNWLGQIVGPHGSGKSTLLAMLVPALQAVGRNVVCVSLHQGEHRLPPLDRSAFTSTTQLVIDGYEQLTWWSKRRTKSLRHRCNAGLLVTAHSDIGLPTLYRTEPSEELARAVIEHLVPNNNGCISVADISAAFGATQGNLRETLFRLYDVYQQRQQ